MLKNPVHSQAIAQQWRRLNLSFIPSEIAITEVNYWHQVIRVIKKFKLGNPSSGLRPPSPKGRRELRPNSKRSELPSPIGRGVGGEGLVPEAVKILKRGGIVVYPTDTSYGLAVDATNEKAVRKLYRLKGRNFKKPMHVIVLSEHYHTILYDSETAKKLIKKFWPGPLTIVLPLKAKGKSWQMLSADTKTIGIRMPNNKIALELVKKFGKPITTTSANLSEKPATYSVADVKKQFPKADLFYLDGGKLPKNQPSTVVSLVGHAKILRPGPITEKQIKNVLLLPSRKPRG